VEDSAGSSRPQLVSADYCDPVIDAYKKDVDRTLLRENLKLSVEERIRKATSFHQSIDAWRGAARRTARSGE
jgi:hypothetical protein